VPKEEWDAVCRHVKIVEVECKRREHEKDSAMERIITSADEDDETSHSSNCHDSDIQGDGPLSGDSEWYWKQLEWHRQQVILFESVRTERISTWKQ
jgi:hypothetical protein